MSEEVRLAFTRRPAPVLPEHRRMYKLAQLVLVLGTASRGGKSSLLRLQLFNWALKNEERKLALLRAANSGRLDVEAWGFDPVLSLALTLAVAESLIEIMPTGYRLSSRGLTFVAALENDAEVLKGEKASLQDIGKRITEGMVMQAAQRWSDA